MAPANNLVTAGRPPDKALAARIGAKMVDYWLTRWGRRRPFLVAGGSRAALARILHFGVGEIGDRAGAGEGPLAGQRLIVKDLFDVAGEPTFAGCDFPIVSQATKTASAVQRLIDAGATYVGKAHMVQLAYGGWGTNACVGAPRNPWDATAVRVAGGSSSGSAVAVAAGFADLALGSDTGGSIRIPASLCGIVGLRPSQGRIAMDGVVPLAPSLDSIGPMARTVSDVAAAFAVLIGEPVVEKRAKPDSLVVRTLIEDDLIADKDVARSYHDAIDRLASAGAQIQTIPLRSRPQDYVAPTGQVMGHEAWALHGARIQAGRKTADPGVLNRFDASSMIDANAYRAAQAIRTSDREQFADWFAGAQFLLTPTTAKTAPRIEEVDEADFTLARYTRMANYLDLCAISLPCGFDNAALPIGLQLVGRAGAEADLLSAALAIESISGLSDRLPPLHVLSK